MLCRRVQPFGNWLGDFQTSCRQTEIAFTNAQSELDMLRLGINDLLGDLATESKELDEYIAETKKSIDAGQEEVTRAADMVRLNYKYRVLESLAGLGHPM